MNELGLSRHCARRGCLGEGKHIPVLKVRLVGQTAVEKPVTVGIPMSLCDKCQKEFEVSSVLTFMGKAQLAIQIALKRGRKVNWDTLEVEWREDRPVIVLPK